MTLRFRVEDLHKSFYGQPVLEGIDLEVGAGETFALIGCSGAGKSVFLRHLVRLLAPDRGKIYWNDEEIAAKSEREMMRLRPRVGYLFQGSGLLSSLTVAENVGLGLVETRRFPRARVNRIVEEKLELVGLEGQGHLLPAELSGGMRKRAALARTLTMEPEAILLDEPTAGLDPPMSESVDQMVLEMKERLSLTFVIVTHDMTHARKVADRVGMLHGGRLVFTGIPDELARSGDERVSSFVRARSR